MITPEEIVGGFVLGGNLETCHGTSLRVHGTQHVVDGTVLARGVASLQTNEQGPLAFGIHQVLKVSQFLAVGLDLGHGMFVGLVLVLEIRHRSPTT